ncbi:MAG: YcfL family protein [Rhodocyclaceae bacterium]|jgi:hypothetical protein|nr:YcfL family protein [Rhodocyclaceae bacterium]MBK6908815.1 YcfL family protein [Rhodocyclaceae bacterium]
MKISTFAGVAASLVLATVTFVPPVAAQTIASKLELQGKPKYLEVTDLMARTRNGLMALNIEISNTDNEPREAFWRVKWLDDTGFPVWADEVWKPLTIQGAAKQNLQVTAPTPKATDFRIQFTAKENSKSIF